MSKFVKYKDCCVVNMDQVSYFNIFTRCIRFFHTDSEDNFTEWRVYSKEEAEYVYELLLNLTNTVVLKDFK
ncbi:hypothetical protein XaC1_457 [Xanthomonas phage XaC1]|nr:hypothetical protein XaC1_457 [Xanthomonas phage XaC1]